MTDIIAVAGTTIAAYFFSLSFPAVTFRPPPLYHSLFKLHSITPQKTKLPHLYQLDKLQENLTKNKPTKWTPNNLSQTAPTPTQQ